MRVATTPRRTRRRRVGAVVEILTTQLFIV
jgi:hypothetical protein